MAFKQRSGNGPLKFKDMGSSPLQTHNTGYDDQYRLIRLPDVTEKEKKDHQASINRESNLSEKELREEKATDKSIREDNQRTFEENKKKEGIREYDKETMNKLVAIRKEDAAHKKGRELTREESDELESNFRKKRMDRDREFRLRNAKDQYGYYLNPGWNNSNRKIQL